MSDFIQKLVPPVGLTLNRVSTIEATTNGYYPNPIKISGYLNNLGNVTAENVKVKVTLPEGLGVVYGTNEISIGSLAVGATKDFYWDVNLPQFQAETTLTYSVEVTADNTQSKVLSNTFSVPALLLSDDHGNTIDKATSIGALDTEIKGRINKGGDIDVFSFKPKVTGVYEIKSSGATDVKGELYNDKDCFINGNWDIDATNKNFSICQHWTSGKTYYLKVSCNDANMIGDYKIKVSKWTPPSNQPLSTQMSSSYNQPIPSNFTVISNGATLNNEVINSNTPNLEKWYKFVVKNNGMLYADVSVEEDGKDVDLELYELDGQQLKLLDISCDIPTQPAYYTDYINYSVTGATQTTPRTFYLRARNISNKPVPPGVYRPKPAPYNYSISAQINEGNTNYGGEKAGWKELKEEFNRFAGVNFLKDNGVQYVVGFDPRSCSPFFDAAKTIKYTEILKKAVSIWNDAQWRYKFSTIESDSIKDYIFVFDENNNIEDHTLDCTLTEDPNWNGIMNNYGDMNTIYFTKEKLMSIKAPSLVGKIGTGNLPTIEDTAVRIFVHEFGHNMGLADLYATTKTSPNSGIDNSNKVMCGVINFWNIDNINKYKYSTFVTDKDVEGICRENGVWKSSNLSSMYVFVGEDELYKDSEMIVKGKVKTVIDSSVMNDYSSVTIASDNYYKDSSGEYKKEVTFLQEGNSVQQYEENALLKEGDECILFLRKGDNGDLFIMGGPQGRYDISSYNEDEIFVEEHLSKIVREDLQNERKMLNSLGIKIISDIRPETTLKEFEKQICNAIKEYDPSHADIIAPSIEKINLSGSMGNNGWYVSDVTISIDAKDGQSGLDKIQYTLNDGEYVDYCKPFTLNTEGSTNIAVQAIDNFGNVSVQQAVYISIDKSLPNIVVNTPIEKGVYLLNQKVNADWYVEDSISRIDSSIATTSIGSQIDTSKPGVKSFNITAIDKAGNHSTKALNYVVKYDFSGINQPINRDGSSIYKVGSTVPVKFQLKDANGNFVDNAKAKLFIKDITVNTDGTEKASVSTAKEVTDNSFRYDLTDNNYIFNLNTKELNKGKWQLKIVLDDTSEYFVNINLK